jgi:hypothetical protein
MGPKAAGNVLPKPDSSVVIAAKTAKGSQRQQVRAGDLRAIPRLPMMRSQTSEGDATMIDPILRKAMEKRDEALREAERWEQEAGRWEQWITDYGKLAGPEEKLGDPAAEVLDIPMARKAGGEVQAADEIDIAASLRAQPQPAEKANGHGLWPRN